MTHRKERKKACKTALYGKTVTSKIPTHLLNKTCKKGVKQKK